MFYSNDNLSFFYFDFNEPEIFKKLKNPIYSSKEELLNYLKTKEHNFISIADIAVNQKVYKTRSGFQFHNLFLNNIIPINYDEIISAIESF